LTSLTRHSTGNAPLTCDNRPRRFSRAQPGASVRGRSWVICGSAPAPRDGRIRR
jgi:hypothetical protein